MINIERSGNRIQQGCEYVFRQWWKIAARRLGSSFSADPRLFFACPVRWVYGSAGSAFRAVSGPVVIFGVLRPVWFRFAFLCPALIFLVSCGLGGERDFPTSERRDGSGRPTRTTDVRESVFGEDGFRGLFGGGSDGGGGGRIGVNGYLWRAGLDTISFMPLASADPFGGVIVTDWFSPPETPGERFKVTIYILGGGLRSDALRVSVFREVLDDGVWRAASPAPDLGRGLEDIVLTRARRYRIDARAAGSGR